MKKYRISIPITSTMVVEVSASSPMAALNKALKTLSEDDYNKIDWEHSPNVDVVVVPNANPIK